MAKGNGRKGPQRTFIPYRTYNFRTKDPAIDELRTLKDDAGVTEAQLHAMSGVSATTFKNWFRGPTMRPTNAAICAAGGALGFERVWQKKRTIDVASEVEEGKRWIEKRKK